MDEVVRVCGKGSESNKVRGLYNLREKQLKNVQQLVQGAPGLVDNIQTYRARHFVNVGVENLVDKADGGRFVRICIRKLREQEKDIRRDQV